MLTKAQLKAMADRQTRLIAARQAPAVKRIGEAMADAKAHALKALTDTLQATPDGRPTIAKARRSRAYGAAVGHLDGLRADLIGMIVDARGEFYRASFAFWLSHMPADMRRSDEPTARTADVAKARAVVLHGMTLDAWIRGATDAAAKGLLPALTRAASRGQAAAEATAIIAAWAAQAEAGILRAARVAINDSYTACDKLAGRDVARPDLLHPDPTIPA